ncbi:proline-rich transmembrane protein 1-like [Saccoglossus kowalevskii]|uniref:Proline-rich transmembrane protein 1-like n=1 Tax=Saccoglossus kowalevskii TaxID=10224 RepID=A0ABM0GWL5_SACKO|nr:PREDICTED: proline-rich transmembrane protein 1-like [Saccoglossus kowalevskii]
MSEEKEKNGMPPPYVVFPDNVVKTQPVAPIGPRMLVNPRDVPNDYLCLALFTTICCFWPISLFAVIKSRNVHRAMWQGDAFTAHRSSIWARRLSIISLVIGLLVIAAFITCKVMMVYYGDDGYDGDRDHHHGGHH